MPYPPIVRVFFAIPIQESLQQKLHEFISSLKKKSKSNVIRWTKPEKFHITLQFLGEIPAEKIPKLIQHVTAKLSNIGKKFQFTVNNAHIFPSSFHPRIILCDVSPEKELALLSEAIGEGIVESGLSIENKPFHPHITLGRIRHVKDPTIPAGHQMTMPDIEWQPVEHVILYQSEPSEDGSLYTPLAELTIT